MTVGGQASKRVINSISSRMFTFLPVAMVNDVGILKVQMQSQWTESDRPAGANQSKWPVGANETVERMSARHVLRSRSGLLCKWRRVAMASR
jgi:hypothetical protein